MMLILLSVVMITLGMIIGFGAACVMVAERIHKIKRDE